MGIPSEKRAQLVHLLNVSSPYSYENYDFEILCNGIQELKEEFEADDDDIQYICETTKTRVISGYKVSMEIEMGYTQNNKIQNWFNNKIRILPTGKDLEIDYIRFNKLEPIFGTSNKFIGVRRKAIGYPTSIGGSSTDPLGCNLTIAGAGDAKVGIVTINENDWGNTYSWADATLELPHVTKLGSGESGIDIKNYHAGITVTAEETGTAANVKIYGIGITDATIKYITKDGNESTSSGTVNASGVWDATVKLDDLAKDANEIYSISFEQIKGTGKSVTTVPLKFKVQAKPNPQPQPQPQQNDNNDNNG